MLVVMAATLGTVAGADSGESTIRKCPSTPNCVSSADPGDSHYTQPFLLARSDREAWQAVRAAVSRLPRVSIVGESQNYIRAECRSRIFGFVDDLELEYHPSAGTVGVRSSSRFGYSDLGVNRRRVEHLRETLMESGIIQSQ